MQNGTFRAQVFLASCCRGDLWEVSRPRQWRLFQSVALFLSRGLSNGPILGSYVVNYSENTTLKQMDEFSGNTHRRPGNFNQGGVYPVDHDPLHKTASSAVRLVSIGSTVSIVSGVIQCRSWNIYIIQSLVWKVAQRSALMLNGKSTSWHFKNLTTLNAIICSPWGSFTRQSSLKMSKGGYFPEITVAVLHINCWHFLTATASLGQWFGGCARCGVWKSSLKMSNLDGDVPVEVSLEIFINLRLIQFCLQFILPP